MRRRAVANNGRRSAVTTKRRRPLPRAAGRRLHVRAYVRDVAYFRFRQRGTALVAAGAEQLLADNVMPARHFGVGGTGEAFDR